MINHGDTIYIELNYTVNDVPLAEDNWDEIEFMFGGYRYSLSEGTIVLDQELGTYCISITQQQTFEMNYIIEYQLRLLKDGDVISTKVQRMPLGNVLSTHVLSGGDNIYV